MATNRNKDKEKEQEAQSTTPTTTPTTTPDPVEEAKKEAQAILDAAKAEAEQIKQEAQEKAEADAKAAFDTAKAEIAAKAGTAPVTAESPKEEMVPIRLFKDNDKYKSDVFVAVNGRTYQIKRGETVLVPKCVAEVLEQSQNQDEATARMIDQESSRYEAEAKRYNL